MDLARLPAGPNPSPSPAPRATRPANGSGRATSSSIRTRHHRGGSRRSAPSADEGVGVDDDSASCGGLGTSSWSSTQERESRERKEDESRREGLQADGGRRGSSSARPLGASCGWGNMGLGGTQGIYRIRSDTNLGQYQSGASRSRNSVPAIKHFCVLNHAFNISASPHLSLKTVYGH